VLGNSLGNMPRNGVFGSNAVDTGGRGSLEAYAPRRGVLVVLAGVVTATAGFMGFRMVPGWSRLPPLEWYRWGILTSYGDASTDEMAAQPESSEIGQRQSIGLASEPPWDSR
jgi:hypothetical protein